MSQWSGSAGAYVTMHSMNGVFSPKRTPADKRKTYDIDYGWIREQISSETEPETRLISILKTVSTPSGNRIELDEDALKSIFLRPEVAEYPVMLVSVSGAFRKGKSFLLNFFLRYMRKEGYKNPNWLGNADLNDGFVWRGGKNPLTHGILIYDEPFVVEYANKKVTVLLMDTQGLFDNNSDKKLCTQIFAFSTLLSSVQVFNLSQQIQENDLEYLQCFTEYAKASQARKATKEAPFQKMMFVVRDWQGIDDHDWGLDVEEDGNPGYLSDILTHSSNNKELTYVRQHLNTSFSELQCFLLPHPGMKVAVTSKKHQFKGELKDIDEEFLQNVQQLADILLNPKFAVPKKINGQVITGNSLVNYAITCARSFAEGGLPEPQTMLQTAEEVMNLQAMRASVDEYTKQMKQAVWDRYVTEDDLKGIHARISSQQVKWFNENCGTINKEGAEILQVKVIDSMMEQYEIFQRKNYATGREIARTVRENANHYVHKYVWKMEENMKGSAMEEHAFEKCHQLTLNATIAAFEAENKCRHGFTDALQAMETDIKFSYAVLARINADKRNLQQLKLKDDIVKTQNVVHECVEQYKEDVGKFAKSYVDPPILVNEHTKARSQAFKSFEVRLLSLSLPENRELSSHLSDKIQHEFNEVEANNETNRRMLGLMLQQKKSKLMLQYRIIMSTGMKDTYVQPEILDETHSKTEHNLVDRMIHDEDIVSICWSPITDPVVRQAATELRNEIQETFQKICLANEENKKLFPQTTGGVKAFFRSIWNSRGST